jgi:adenylyltransferase and sulfurtransferase
MQFINDSSTSCCGYESELEYHEIERYSRQLLTGQHWGVSHQVKLRHATVLIVGAAIPYLAGAGIGTLQIVDDDVVELPNLHRQGILHRNNLGHRKAASAAQAVQCLSPHTTVKAFEGRITPDTISLYLQQEVGEDQSMKKTPISCVVDCSDNPYTRYTLNDACFFHKIPLVSASAIGSSAQLTVFDYTECCYRCLFPYNNATVPAANCNDHGVWGPVPGLIGTAAAMECLKVVGGFGEPLYHHTLVYQADTGEAQRYRKPSKSRKNCFLCGESPILHTLQDTKDNLKGLLSCKNSMAKDTDTVKKIPHVSAKDYQRVRMMHTPHILLDVRNSAQFQLVHLPHSLHLPLNELLQHQSVPSLLQNVLEGNETPVYVLCRRGIASATAVRHLQIIWPEKSNLYHIEGGLDAWRTNVDPSFPKY